MTLTCHAPPKQRTTTTAEDSLKRHLRARCLGRIARCTSLVFNPTTGPHRTGSRTLAPADFAEGRELGPGPALILMTVVAPRRRSEPACGRGRANGRMLHCGSV